MQEPIQDPAKFPWHEVSKVQHYWMERGGNDPADAGYGMTRTDYGQQSRYTSVRFEA